VHLRQPWSRASIEQRLERMQPGCRPLRAQPLRERCEELGIGDDQISGLERSFRRNPQQELGPDARGIALGNDEWVNDGRGHWRSLARHPNIRGDMGGEDVGRRGAPRTWGIVTLLGLSVLALPLAHAREPRSVRSASAAPPAAAYGDASVLPRGKTHPPLVAPGAQSNGKPARQPTTSLGWSRDVLEPAFVDRRRRLPRTARPADFGHLLRPGEKFKFSVSFAGNPAGLAEAQIIGLEPDPNAGPGGAPLLRLEGHARTSGVVSLLATVTDDMVTLIDPQSGAAVSSRNIIEYQGWAPRKYKQRITEQSYRGRGFVRIVDTKDGVGSTKVKRAPLDTFDPLSAMAWVRSLDLEKGERAKAHAVDGTTLLRIEIESKGNQPMKNVPSIVQALELRPEDLLMIEGVLTHVDAYDQAIPGKRAYKLRAWLSRDERRIPLVLESDMWVGAIRLELSSYDPPPS
jgi:hypothetical protein